LRIHGTDVVEERAIYLIREYDDGGFTGDID
jgi:hypothetical protein